MPRFAGVEDGRAIEQGLLAFGARFELAEELAEHLDLGLFDQRQLLELGWVLAVVGGVVVAQVHAVDLRPFLRAQKQRDDARRVSLQSQVDDVVPLPAALEQFRAAEVAGGRP